jgi:hypothetical protein
MIAVRLVGADGWKFLIGAMVVVRSFAAMRSSPLELVA